MSRPAIISVTDSATDYIQTILSKKSLPDSSCDGLRISVEKGGCSGYEYAFSFVNQALPDDEIVMHKGIRLYIDPTAVLRVIGSTLDYEQDVFSEKLVFRNPNETSRCGCGKSASF